MTKKATPDQIAAEWIARLDRRQLTAEEDRLLQNWIREDVRHKGAFLRCQAIWHATNRAQALRSPAADWSQRRQLPSRRMVVSTAAAAFFVPFLYRQEQQKQKFSMKPIGIFCILQKNGVEN